MTPAKLEFRREGIDCLQIVRDGMVAIYELSKPHWTRKSYEVVILREKGSRKAAFPGRATSDRLVTFRAQETLPAWKEWGQAGWSYMALEPAMAKFNALIALR